MKNRDRRKIVANIFADTAKYSLTAGVLGSIISKEFTMGIGIILGSVTLLMIALAYKITSVNEL